MDNQNPFGQTGMPVTQKTSSAGPIIGLIIILAVILVGGIYYFYKSVDTNSTANYSADQSENQDETAAQADTSIEAELENLDAEAIDDIGSDVF